MFGLFELIQQYLFPLLPSGLRLAIARASLRRIPVSEVVVYAFTKESRRRFEPFLATDFALDTKSEPVVYSLICTTRNEEKGIIPFLDSIAKQQCLPSELIICDAGSSDNTLKKIEEWKSKNQNIFDIIAFEHKGASISLGRNLAVAKAKNEILALTDAGATLDKQWAKRILTPFSIDPETEVSMGWYKPIVKNAYQKALALFLLPRIDTLDPSVFLPSGRSLALRKNLYEAVGGYPEHVSFAGEDTLFDCFLKTAAKKIAFVPDAYCYWVMPLDIKSTFKTIFRYSKGDGESGELWTYYFSLIRNILSLAFELICSFIFLILYFSFSSKIFCYLALFFFFLYLVKGLRVFMMYRAHEGAGLKELFFRGLALKVMLLAQSLGFLSGLKSRPLVEEKRILKAKKGHIFVLLPEIPVYDSGSTQMKKIQSLLKDGWYVTALYALKAKEQGVSFRHSQFESYARKEFSLEAWLSKHSVFLGNESREFNYLDLCEDSLSQEFILSLEPLACLDFNQ